MRLTVYDSLGFYCESIDAEVTFQVRHFDLRINEKKLPFIKKQVFHF